MLRASGQGQSSLEKRGKLHGSREILRGGEHVIVWLSAVGKPGQPQRITNRDYASRVGITGDGWRYRSRGLVQITGRDNYAKYGIADNPDAALDPIKAIEILFDGMTNSRFTGKELADFFSATADEWIGARKIINSTDHSIDIAGYARKFAAAIEAVR